MVNLTETLSLRDQKRKQMIFSCFNKFLKLIGESVEVSVWWLVIYSAYKLQLSYKEHTFNSYFIIGVYKSIFRRLTMCDQPVCDHRQSEETVKTVWNNKNASKKKLLSSSS